MKISYIDDARRFLVLAGTWTEFFGKALDNKYDRYVNLTTFDIVLAIWKVFRGSMLLSLQSCLLSPQPLPWLTYPPPPQNRFFRWVVPVEPAVPEKDFARKCVCNDCWRSNLKLPALCSPLGPWRLLCHHLPNQIFYLPKLSYLYKCTDFVI